MQKTSHLVFIYLSSALHPILSSLPSPAPPPILHMLDPVFWTTQITFHVVIKYAANQPDREMSEHRKLNNVNISLCFPFLFLSPPRSTQQQRWWLPKAPQLPLALPLHRLQDFPMFVSLALDFVTHVTAARWYHTTASACCPPYFHITQRVQRQC